MMQERLLSDGRGDVLPGDPKADRELVGATPWLTRRLILAILFAVGVASVTSFALASGIGAARPEPERGPPELAPRFTGLWRRAGRCPGERVHEVVFVLRPRGEPDFERLVLNLSSPGHPSYRQWLSWAQVRELTANAEAVGAVKAVLWEELGLGRGAVAETACGGFVRARAPVASWERLFGTQFHLYERSGAEPCPRADSVALPRPLLEHVVGVLGVLDLEHAPAPAPVRARAATRGRRLSGSGEGRFRGYVTPTRLFEAYGIPPPGDKRHQILRESRTTQAVFSGLGQYWSPRDLGEFQREFGLPHREAEELDKGGAASPVIRRLPSWFTKRFPHFAPHLFPKIPAADASNLHCAISPSDCLEANLDVEYMAAMSPYSQLGLYYLGLKDPLETGTWQRKNLFYDFVVQLSEMNDPPHVVSISYGGVELAKSHAILEAFGLVAMKLAAQGVTILASSGDSGANGLGAFLKGASCKQILEKYGLAVSWPASSPWVTAVGATMGIEVGMPEIACSVNATGPTAAALATQPLITSGGGFSTYFPRPEWQNIASGKRGIPDVSMAGHGYATRVAGQWDVLDGTSASSPVFAGLVSLFNAYLYSNINDTCARDTGGSCRILDCWSSRGPATCTKTGTMTYKCICNPGFCAVDGVCQRTANSSVGFLNPTLYNHPEMFKDIISGDNRCGAQNAQCCGGYDAGKGWDPVTGLGVVKVPEVMKTLGIPTTS